MAVLSCFGFSCCTRTQFQLLLRQTGSFEYFFTVYRIKYPYICHRAFCENPRSRYHDADAQKMQTQEVVSNSNTEDQSFAESHCVFSSGMKKMNRVSELLGFQSRRKVGNCRKQDISAEQLSECVRSRKIPTSSEHFRRSWRKYYSVVTKKEWNFAYTGSLGKKERKKVNDKSETKNIFGSLNSEISIENQRYDKRHPNERFEESIPEDTDEKRNYRLDIPLTTYGRKNKRNFYYTRKISLLSRQGKIKEAIAVFEDLMMVRDRVMPSKRTFVVLIGMLGRTGYARKAFEMFGKMKQLGLDPVDHIYTSLFNACANAPADDDGLKRTEYLLNHLKEKGILPNLFTVKAAMKALAICGDFPRTFTLLDETSKRLQLDVECFNHLLMACISDNEAGFRRALQVWQKMHRYRVQPDIHTFNLLLRSVRDCDAGNLRTFAASIDIGSSEISEISSFLEINNCLERRHSNRQNPLLISPGVLNVPNSASGDANSSNSVTESEEVSSVNFRESLTDVSLVASDHAKNKNSTKSLYADILTEATCNTSEKEKRIRISLKDLKVPSGRLAFLGGAKKFISFMETLGSHPDMKTFAQILACLPDDEQNEFELLKLMEERNVNPDIDFLNDIMMRRNRRKESDSAKAVLRVMSKLRLVPNMRTYAAIALTCHKEKDALEMLQDMKEANVEPNAVIMGHLLYISGCNYTYKLKVLKAMESLGLKPSKENIAVIERSIMLTKKRIIETEKKRDVNSFFLSESFQKSFQFFMSYYQMWLTKVELAKPRHAWDAFKPAPNLKEKKTDPITTDDEIIL